MEDYSARLTGEPFLYNETKILAKYLIQGEDINELRKRNVDENLIMHKTKSSILRVNSGIFNRLQAMDDEILYDFVNSDVDTSKIILLYIIMKTNKLVNDFVNDIYKEKILIGSDLIYDYDINGWIKEKCDNSPTLSKCTDSTRYKLRQVLIKILKDAGLVKYQKDSYLIIRPLLTEEYIDLLKKHNDEDYLKAIGGLR
ncbi:MAG: DUF1819 family protein [Clostridia bacterium]|nr:DUF1819 family protein [Clostridia bacterium]